MILRSIVILFLVVFTTLNAHAATITAVQPSGKGTFIIQGDNMGGVGGMDIKIKYDPAILTSPTVTQGSLISGAMMAANTTVTGSIHIAVISTKPISGTGQIATITFASSKASGGIISVDAKTIDTGGKELPTQGLITHPGIPFSESKEKEDNGKSGDAAAPSSTTDTPSPVSPPIQATPTTPVIVPPPATVPPSATATGRSVTTGTYSGTINMPAETSAEDRPAPKEPPPAPESDPLPDSSTPRSPQPPLKEEQPVKEEEPSSPASNTVHKAVLEHFRSFTGVKAPATYSALFNNTSSAISQNPAIAISDGTTPLTIVAKLGGPTMVSPNFALSGAKLVSITKTGNTWTIIATPRAKALQASLTILSGQTLIEFPLTLAPPVNGISFAETDFTAFIKDSGVTPPKHDLNGDGVHDYQDDYIYTAHYLIKKSAATKKSE